MKEQELQELLTKAGVKVNEDIKISDIQEGVNSFANGLVARKETEFKKTLDSSGIDKVNEFIKNSGLANVENKEQFETYLVNQNKSNDVNLKKVTSLEKDLQVANEWQPKYDNLNKDFTKLTNNNLADKYNIDPKFKDFVIAESSKNVTDDTDIKKAMQDYIKAQPQYKITQKASGVHNNKIETKTDKQYLDNRYKNNPHYKG